MLWSRLEITIFFASIIRIHNVSYKSKTFSIQWKHSLRTAWPTFISEYLLFVWKSVWVLKSKIFGQKSAYSKETTELCEFNCWQFVKKNKCSIFKVNFLRQESSESLTNVVRWDLNFFVLFFHKKNTVLTSILTSEVSLYGSPASPWAGAYAKNPIRNIGKIWHNLCLNVTGQHLLRAHFFIFFL